MTAGAPTAKCSNSIGFTRIWPLRRGKPPASLNATIGAPVGQLDAETVARASQALSSEIVLPKLIERLMRIAVEHAGAERGLLILLRGSEPLIEAEATTGHGRVDVQVRQTEMTSSDLPQSALAVRDPDAGASGPRRRVGQKPVFRGRSIWRRGKPNPCSACRSSNKRS